MPGPRPEQLPTTGDVPPVRLILADTQAIFRVGMRKILAGEEDIRVVAQAETLGQTLASVPKFPADVLLFEARLSPAPAEAVSEILKRAPWLKVVVMVSEQNEQEIVDYLRRGVRGIVTRSIGPELLVRCVRKVAEGETWLDNRGVNWVIQAYRKQATQLGTSPPKGRLSEKELIIISGVTHGMRNKDIAAEVGTTEQVVKNCLRKIYDKLGISDRLELAIYCVHQRLLEKHNGVLPRVPSSDHAPPAPAADPASSAAPQTHLMKSSRSRPAVKAGKRRRRVHANGVRPR